MAAAFPRTGPLLTRRLNTDLIAEHYDDLLRVAGSLQFGHATASPLVGKLSAPGRQNALSTALKEYGALLRTVYAARYLADPPTIGGGSRGSSTRASRCTRSNATCSTRTRARCGPGTFSSRPSRRGA
ncbi:hypothetical protein A6A25_30705 [Saccharothrix sp. CB00851]|nr:hypothetical protein A6A25_30705 [Saccharothrix sp. CB00851]